jgi:hypothetical protein
MFHIQDSHPDVELCEIEPTEARIKSLVARNLHVCESLDKNVSIVGSLRIIDGLSYHYKNYKRFCVELESYLKRHREYALALKSGLPMTDLQAPDLANRDETLLLDGIHHETVAYLNRMGQFFYFAQQSGAISLLPHISSLMPFRNKHAAHRSIDAPRGEAVVERRLQSISVGLASSLSNGVPIATLKHGNEFLQFSFDEDHPVIIEEVYLIYFYIFSSGETV